MHCPEGVVAALVRNYRLSSRYSNDFRYPRTSLQGFQAKMITAKQLAEVGRKAFYHRSSPRDVIHVDRRYKLLVELFAQSEGIDESTES